MDRSQAVEPLLVVTLLYILTERKALLSNHIRLTRTSACSRPLAIIKAVMESSHVWGYELVVGCFRCARESAIRVGVFRGWDVLKWMGMSHWYALFHGAFDDDFRSSRDII